MTTLALDPAAPVVTDPTCTVAEAPEAPVGPLGPAGPIAPSLPLLPALPWDASKLQAGENPGVFPAFPAICEMYPDP